MMLVMKAEVEARQQRQPNRKRVRARVVPIEERFAARPMRQVRAEGEELQRRQEARHCPEHQQVRRTSAEQDNVHEQYRGDDHHLAKPEIMREEGRKPAPEVVRRSLVEIGILGRPGVPVMLVVFDVEPVEVEARIEEQA